MISQRKDLYRFGKKIALAFGLAALFFAFSFYLLAASGELLSTDEAVDRQLHSTQRATYGTYFSTIDLYYKWVMTLRKAPEILALGTSRSMQFREPFFKKGVSFYTAGATTSSLARNRYLIDSLAREKQPRLVILVLDQIQFNPNHPHEQSPADVRLPFQVQTTRQEVLKLGSVGVYRQMIEHGFPFRLFNGHADGDIGLSALTDNSGFRKDGSIAVNTKKIKPTRFNDAFRSIESGEKVFQYGTSISTGQIAGLKDVLSLCKQRGIYVIALLPPYPHVVYEKMKSREADYAHVFQLDAAVRGLFKTYGYGYFDFTDLAQLGASDEETYDGNHGSEKAYLRLFIRMATEDAVLGHYVDIPALKKRLETAVGPYYVFGDTDP